MFVIARMHIDLQQLFRLETPGGPRPAQLLPSHHGRKLRLAHLGCSPIAMAATRDKPATVLVVNTLTSKPGETPHALLDRNGLETHLLQDMQLVLCPECGVPQADRHDRFNGVTMAVLELRVPEGHDVPLQNGLAFAPSRGRLVSREVVNQRFIQICDRGLEFAKPLPEARPGWPLPLVQFLDCLTPSAHDAVLEMLTHAVDVMRRLVDTAVSTDDAMKHPPNNNMAEVASVGRRYRAASQPQAVPISHHHISG